ncbi:MAG: nitronate monooxygenase family protein [Endomicrobiia bacterium]|nr:nitronate monooxygenase family protein [Endomicrobiaceae bacterium]MDD3923179.1 nitronate monooxygenase family protein [Endomicrobiaceae bacterium]
MIENNGLKIDDLKASIPIIQGGMGIGISGANLAAAVAQEGAIGVISSVGLGLFCKDSSVGYRTANQEMLKKEIRRAKEMTKGILGVNIMAVVSDFEDLVKIAVNEKVDLIIVGGGLPLKNPLKNFGKVKTKILLKVSSARAASLLFKYWDKNYNTVPDGVVVEGPLAGGHLGFKPETLNDPQNKLECLVPEVIQAVIPFRNKFKKDIPVIAAGGIYTGADMCKFIKMGASAVKMATRFVATYECDASEEFKKTYINCTKEDIGIIKSPVGLPGRAILNDFTREIAAGHKKPFNCLWKCLKTCDYKISPYCISMALVNARNGNLKDGFAFAGANAYLVDKIVSVKELIQSIMQEYNVACAI